MASRGLHLLLSSHPLEEIAWLKKLGQQQRSFTMRQMVAIEQIINRLELPCQLETKTDMTSLHIFTRNAEVNSPHERPVPLLTIRDSHVPRGAQDHPRFGTLGRAWLIRLALNNENKTRCTSAGIHPGSLRPGILTLYR